MVKHRVYFIGGETMHESVTHFFGYDGCLALENDAGARVVLSPLAGVRVLECSLDGTNALYLNPAQQGWRNVPGVPVVDPCGGRLDVGPEKTITPHPDLWLGDWTGEIVGEGRARLTSARDRMTGLRLVREFTLAPDSSRLTVEQRVTNESDKPVTCCHWSRTLAAGGGIVLIPLTSDSRFPKSYIMYGPKDVNAMFFQPVDPNIRVRDGFLEILGTPKFPKLGMDSAAGWFSYLTRSNLLFTKNIRSTPSAYTARWRASRSRSGTSRTRCASWSRSDRSKGLSPARRSASSRSGRCSGGVIPRRGRTLICQR